MKVLKKGKLWTKKYVCTGAGNGGHGCGATLLIEEGDLFRTGSHHWDCGSEYFVTFTCVECGVMTDIKGYPGDIWKLKKGVGGGDSR